MHVADEKRALGEAGRGSSERLVAHLETGSDKAALGLGLVSRRRDWNPFRSTPNENRRHAPVSRFLNRAMTRKSLWVANS
jgi:hypothetical protein